MVNKNKINFIAHTSIYTALLCIFAQISIPTPPVPFTLSLLVIFIIASVLPLKTSFASVFLYVILGAIGLPVFSLFRGGFAVLAGPTGGYIMAYPIMAIIIGAFYKVKKFSVFFNIVSMFLALAVCYLIGTLWFSFVMEMSFLESLIICVLPFVWFDILKLAIAAFVSPLIKRALKDFSVSAGSDSEEGVEINE